MRLVFFIGGLAAGAFTTFRIARLPESFHDLNGSDGPKRMLALAFLLLTLMAMAVTYLCVKEVFAPSRSKGK